MGRLTKRQQKKINYFLREKAEFKKKQILQEDGTPKFIDKHLPYIRKLARNLDQVLIVSSFINPPFKPGLIDRFLVLTEIENLKPIICLNKIDLLDDRVEVDHLVKIYRDIGYEAFATSVKTGEGVPEVFELLKKKRTALAGHSGVGKSSLLNAMDPKLKLKVNEVSQSTHKGKHTTTQVKIFTMAKKTEVIDLPGVKLVDFVDIHRTEARFYYREFLQYSDQCKFRDCLHLTEIECGVKTAVDKGSIDAMRYKSYCTFVDTLV